MTTYERLFVEVSEVERYTLPLSAKGFEPLESVEIGYRDLSLRLETKNGVEETLVTYEDIERSHEDLELRGVVDFLYEELLVRTGSSPFRRLQVVLPLPLGAYKQLRGYQHHLLPLLDKCARRGFLVVLKFSLSDLAPVPTMVEEYVTSEERELLRDFFHLLGTPQKLRFSPYSLYTDASTVFGYSAGAYIIFTGTEVSKEVFLKGEERVMTYKSKGSVQEYELRVLLTGLKACIKNHRVRLTIRTDADLESLSRTKNEKLKALMEKYHHLMRVIEVGLDHLVDVGIEVRDGNFGYTWEKVKSHSGELGNDYVDKLARKHARELYEVGTGVKRKRKKKSKKKVAEP